jgi:hypothetical protein
MTTAAADFYEKFFEKNYEEKIPPVFLEEVLEIVNGRNKKSRMMLMAYVTTCLTFSQFLTGAFYYRPLISHSHKLIYLQPRKTLECSYSLKKTQSVHHH